MDSPNNTHVDQQPFPKSATPRKLKPFQFRLRSLFIITVVLSVLLAVGRTEIGSEILGPLLAIAIQAAVFLGPLASVVLLADRLSLSSRVGLEFGNWGKMTLVVFTGLNSVCMLMLATIAFEPDWKGEKGLHWGYYLLDAPAGYTLWPIYWLGVLSFIAGVLNPQYAIRSRMNLVLVLTLAVISAWYVFAVVFMKFGDIGGIIAAYMPGIVCVEYTLYAWLIIRHAKFADWKSLSFFAWLFAWLAAVSAAIAVKIPIAMRFYEDLPDQSPPGCFIVTAASRGHEWMVRTWRDDSGRIVNRQLLTFWQWEALLAAKAPGMHRALRAVYNRCAPLLARCIMFPWMADVLYLLLKPAEWFAAALNRLGQRK